MIEIKDKEENAAFLEVIEILMEGDPLPATDQGVALGYLVGLVKAFEDKTYGK